jgi:hypothetical protein
MRPSVYVVPQEEVVNVGDVSCCGGGAILLEESHQVPKLTVKVTEELDGSCTTATHSAHSHRSDAYDPEQE